MRTQTKLPSFIPAVTGIALCCITCLPSRAQITLTQGSYSGSEIGEDTLANTKITSTFPNLTSQTNAEWDMTKITDTTVYGYHYRVSPVVSMATYADSNYYDFSGYTYPGNEQRAVTATALMSYAVSIPRIAYSLSHVTGGANDSLIYLNQIDTDYNFNWSSHVAAPITIIAFPATYNDSWSSKLHANVQLELSVASLGYNHAPTVVQSEGERFDSVKGWGKMQVKNLTGSDSSGWINVLQVQTSATSIDSFYINGSPASAVVLNAFGISQGEQIWQYEQEYYMPGYVTPLATVSYSSSTFKTPTHASTKMSQWAYTGITYIPGNVASVSVYPNPNNGRFSIQLEGMQNFAPAQSVEIYNMLGEKVFTATLSNTQGNNPVDIGFLPNGVYLYRIITAEGNLTGQGKIVLQK